MTKAAEEVLPNTKRVQKQPWMTEEILGKMEKRKIAKSLDPEKYNQLKKGVFTMLLIIITLELKD